METIINDLKNLSASDLENFIQVAETLKKNKSSPQKASPLGNHPSVESLSEYYKESGIDAQTVDDAMSEIEDLSVHFIKQKTPHRPTLLVIGVRYFFSRNTENCLVPVPFSDAPKVAALVKAFNVKYGTDYNSVLVSKYKDLNYFLPWHKDDEHMLDPNHPIGSFSDGAWRRFQVSANKNKGEAIFEYLLAARSLLVMKPGFQTHFYHQLAEGRRKFANETGRRINLTMRKVLDNFIDPPPVKTPDISEPVNTVEKAEVAAEKEAEVEAAVKEVKEVEVAVKVKFNDEVDVEEVAVKPDEDKVNAERRRKSKLKTPVFSSSGDKTAVCDAVVFGSSLVKGLNPKLLAKYGKSFTVVSHSSAHVEDIINDIKAVKDKGTIACDGVKTVFFVCGGNDVENLPGDHTIDNIKEDFINLMSVAKEIFPGALINIMSLIPRRVNSYGQEHVWLMHDVNTFLSQECKKRGIRFVNAYSCYIRSNGRLNNRLFNSSRLHFSDIGNSVLGKLVIAVTHKPYT